MFQIAYDYQKDWPEDEPLTVEIQLTHQITISPVLAQRRANGFFAGYVTMMVTGGKPTLILNEKPVWRVPGMLTLSQVGEVGPVGYVDIDAQTGEVISSSPEQINRMQEIAHALAAHFTSETTPAS